MNTPTFYLGTHRPGWLTTAGVPLFVSDRTIRDYKTLPTATAPWALDSGGFTELQKYGRWTATPQEYADRVRRYRDHIGHLQWAAPQDWMCEPFVINGGTFGPMTFAGTGLAVAEHQQRTVDNYLELTDIAPDLPFTPVLQGYTQADYHNCADRYADAGVDLTTAPLVGLGSVCRRQATGEAHQIIRSLHNRGITRLHGFGVKADGLRRYGHLLASADSLAWSYGARRRQIQLPGCTTHKNCANCIHYALQWRDNVLGATQRDEPETLPLWDIDEDEYQQPQELGEAVGL